MISLSQVRFRWHRDLPVVLDIERLEVAPGERVFVRGPSGSGKTTLLNLLGGIAVPEAGSVTIGGVEVSALGGARRDRFRADRLGIIFQMFNLVPYLSMTENVLLPCRFSARRRERVGARATDPSAEAVRLLDRMGLDVEGLGDRPAAELSTGQQQRVAAARALIGGPDLVIADEPTSALDAEARQAFLDLLFAEIAAEGATLVFVSHDPALEPAFDRTVSLADVNRAGPLAA